MDYRTTFPIDKNKYMVANKKRKTLSLWLFMWKLKQREAQQLNVGLLQNLNLKKKYV